MKNAINMENLWQVAEYVQNKSDLVSGLNLKDHTKEQHDQKLYMQKLIV